MDEKAIYPYSLEYAKQNSPQDVELYKLSHKQNIACKNAIEQAIRESFDGLRLGKNSGEQVIADFGYDRVNLVLANTVQRKDYDGRFSRDNKEWAKTFPIPEDMVFDRDRRNDFVVDSHPAVLDGFINQTRRTFAQLKPSVQKQLEAVRKDSKTIKAPVKDRRER